MAANSGDCGGTIKRVFPERGEGAGPNPLLNIQRLTHSWCSLSTHTVQVNSEAQSGQGVLGKIQIHTVKSSGRASEANTGTRSAACKQL